MLVIKCFCVQIYGFFVIYPNFLPYCCKLDAYFIKMSSFAGKICINIQYLLKICRIL